MSQNRIILITGTDTEVGKTVVGFGLARHLTRDGLRVRTVKPVESGCGDAPSEGEDGVILAHATGQALPRAALTRLRRPVAPPLAAEREGIRLDLGEMCEAVRALAIDQDVVIVEGAGGLLSPLSWHANARDMAVELGAEALLVAPDRLGTLNHTLMALEILATARVPILGVVLNSPPSPDDSTGTNADALRRVTGLGRVAVLPRLRSLDEAVDHLTEVAGWIGR